MIWALRRITASVLPLVLLAGVVAAVLGRDQAEATSTQARIDVDGVAAVTRVDGREQQVTDQATLDFGDAVELRSGTATLTLASGAGYELRHHQGTGSDVVVGAPLRVSAGQVLVAEGFPARVQVAGATLSARGPLKVDAERELATSYGGGATVAGAGDVTELRRLRQLVLVPGATPQPSEFDGADPWDRRHLGEAIAFGERLEALARGYTSDVPPGGALSAAFFASVLPALADEREFGDDLLDPARSPGDTLVGAAIAVQGDEGSFRQRWAEVFEFRGAGAAWGLVALDQGVSSAPLLQTLELAIDAAPPATATTAATTSSSAPAAPEATTTPPTTTTTTAPPPPPPSGGLLDPGPGSEDGPLDGLLGEPLRSG